MVRNRCNEYKNVWRELQYRIVRWVSVKSIAALLNAEIKNTLKKCLVCACDR